MKRTMIAVSVTLALSACGGGGGSGSMETSSEMKPTVYNPDGTPSSSFIPPAPKPAETPAAVETKPAQPELPTQEPTPQEPQIAQADPPKVTQAQSQPEETLPPVVNEPPKVATITPKPADTPPPKTSEPIVPAKIEPVSPSGSPGRTAQMFLNNITSPTPPSARLTSDMPDQYNDHQVHVIYAVAKGEADRGRDVTNYFTNSINVWNNWMRIESGGRKIKFDVYQDKLDLTYIQLPKTDKEYSVYGSEKNEVISNDIKAILGEFKTNKKYLVYMEGGRQYDSDYVSCGDTKINHPVVIQYLLGDPKGAECFAGRDLASSTSLEPRYLDYIAIHELIHSEGGVSDSAPNEERHHLNGDESDIMALRGNFDGWKVLDITKSNYYNLKGLPAGVYNFANSKLLTPPGTF